MDAVDGFRAYVTGRAAALSRTAYLLTGDVHLAEDLVQTTLIQLARHWERVAAAGDPEPYVRRVMYSQHVSAWRRRWRGVELRADVPDRPLPDTSSRVAVAVAVRAALRGLAPRQRAVLVLRYFEDLTEVQAAEVLGCSVNTPKKR